MNVVYRLNFIVILFFVALFSNAQNFNQLNSIKKSTPGACMDKSCTSVQPKVGSFSNAYTQTQCGLNYAISGVKLTQRATWQPGVGQPAVLNISSIPPCVVPASGHILRAYVYWIVEGGATTGSVNLTNPLGITQNFPGTLIGDVAGGKCWSCPGTRHFRADVTSHITGNGNYTISGLPVGNPCGDTDGAVLVIVYRDPAATYQGTIVLHDGNILVTGGAQNHTLSGFNACGPTSNATAFTVTGDLQSNISGPWDVTMNGITAPVTPNFFNLDIRNVTVASGQSTSLFGVSAANDCWSWILAGLYFQTTTCVTCTPSGTISTPGAVSGPTTLCAGQTATYSVGSVSGATSYNWTVPAGWTINSGQGSTSISITAGATSGNVCVTASNACGSSSPSCTNVTINTAPAQPASISGSASVCSGQNLTYAITPVTGATSYNWTVPAGWTINSGQGTTSINVTVGASTGNICVTASNACGTSPVRCLAVSVGSVPVTPGTITGASPVCPTTTNTYSIAPVTGATSYTWTVPAGWTINSGQGSTSISITAGATSGNVCVTASNACGSSSPSCTNVTINTAPAQPASISGSASVCSGQNLTYAITPVTGATSYNWTVPAGWTINSGQGTTSINVTVGASTGNICVTASNACGTSPVRCLAVSVGSVPVTPGTITGASPVCPTTTNTYSIAPVTGATSYTWTVPAGWTINSGQGSTSISTTAGAAGGNICVTASNVCGTSASQCINITMNTNSTAPTSITATTNPTCGGSTTLTVNGGSLGTGAQWQWYSGSCGGTPVGTGNSITVTPATTTTYFVRAQGVCGNTTCASITITVNTPSTAATAINATTNPTCGGSTTLSVVGGSLGTGASWNWYSGSCGGTPVGTGNSITVTPGVTTTYFVRAQGVCGNTTCTSITITVNTPSTAPTSATANPSAICVGNSSTLTVNGGSLGTGAQWQWYSGSCGGTPVGSGISITVSPTTTTTYFVRAEGTCNNTTCASVTVTVDQNPAPSNAGANQSVCGLSTTLAGNTPSIGTGTWTQVSGPGTITFSNINNPSSTATASTYGMYVLEWTIINSTCSTSSTVNITFDEMPNPANAGVDTGICGLTANMSGTPTNIGVITWSQLSGPGTTSFNNPNQNNTSINVSTSGMYEYILTVTNGVCVTSDTVVFNFFDIPIPVNAGTDTAVCGLSLNLNALTPSSGTGTWTQVSGPVIATIDNVNNVNSQFSATQYGNYTLIWTVVNGVCSFDDTVNVRFDQTPSIANAGVDTTICTNNYILNGNIPLVGNGIWSTTSNGVIMSDSTSHDNNLSSLALGVNTFIWTISNGVCPSSSDTVKINVNPSSIIPDFRTDTNEIYAYQIVSFIDLSTGNPDSWHWNFGDGDTSAIQNPGHIYTDIGIYPVMLVITNALGCRDTIIKDIEVKERFLVPNIFTPNNDGINDVFKVIASGYKDFSMQIYNRFGQVIFESFNPTIGWNGKTVSEIDVSEGTYFYIIKAVAPDGKEIIEKGPIQLLR